MFKWVTPASTATLSRCTETTIITTTATATATRTATTTSTRRTTKPQLLSIALTSLIIIVASFVPTTSGFRSIETNGANGRKLFGGYRITPKHCRATKTLPSSDPRANGPTICMFNHECAQRGGEVVGACMDGFLFGACCQIPPTHELASTLINEAQNAYFQQHQQQTKLQQAAAQSSFESYGEQQQQQLLSEEQVSQQPSQSIYDQQNLDKVYQQLDSSSSISPPSGVYGDEPQLQEQQEDQPESEAPVYSSSSASTESSTQSQSSSSSVEFEQEPSQQADISSDQTTQEITKQPVQPPIQPPNFHVHKHSVTINSPSSPPQNDDFVMQVLSTLPPEHADDHHVVFTTEVPMKIASGLQDQTSSESNSFEEVSSTPAATQKPKTKPTQKVTQKPTQKPTPKATQKPKPKPVPQLAETMKRPVQQAKPKPNPKPVQTAANNHHHNHLILDGGEFTHSDITHPGADADLVEDLQFSTGYGPQPVYADPPKQQQQQQQQQEQNYISSSTSAKRPTTGQNSPTTVSSITTHVDSIESIILQLNNTSHGPSYNVVSQQTPSYGYPGVGSVHTEPATQPPTFYQDNEAEKVQEQDSQSDYGYTTTVNYEPSYDKVSDEQDASAAVSQSAEMPTARPGYGEDMSAVLEDHTLPANGYHDAVAPVAPQTSEFNKMPVMGIAYPVDMSYMEEEEHSPATAAGYGQAISSDSYEASTESAYQKLSTVQTEEPQPVPTYVRPTTNANKQNRPVASYIGMVTMQQYSPRPQTSGNADYQAQVPAEVSVSSHTTKVQEQYDETSNAYQQSETTSGYVAPPTAAPPAAQRPQYDAVSEDASSERPVLVTASPTRPRPKPITKRPAVKRPISGENTKKKPQPQPSAGAYNQDKISEHSSTRRPVSSGYDNVPESPITHIQIKKPAADHHKEQEQTGYPRPASGVYEQTTAASAPPAALPAAPSLSYDKPDAPASQYTQPSAPSAGYDQLAPMPSLNYNEEHVASSPGRKPSTGKPVSTSYVTGPSTPRPPATVDYHYDNVPPLFMADDKLDAFIQSTAENIVGSTPGNYQPPLVATASTPIYAHRPTVSGSYGHKKPGFVQINGTPKPPRPTVLITPKPTTINLITYSSQSDDSNKLATSTGAYVTGRPGAQGVGSNDFEDPGYFGSSPVHAAFIQSTTEAIYAVPSDDKPAFPGYFGPTPSYPAFSVPGEKVGQNVVEETYTSPNDFVNFPPVRNPNLNMSAAASSAVTSDLDLSTPAFVEDVVLKDKMHTLVHKLVASLQGNFEALADMIDEPGSNKTVATYQAGAGGAGGAGGAAKPVKVATTRKPVRIATTTRPKVTTKKPVTRVTTKAPNKKTSAVSSTTRKPVTRRTTVAAKVTTTTRKPATKKPTRRVSSTVKTTTESSARPADDEIVDEEDEEDVNPNPSDNEIDQGATLSSYGGANGRKIQCGVRPHVKSGRIVGGKGSTFGAFPWQVLVRESTWLGLFTKNKCGGVLITSRYVITAAHCQPGFLASLVAVMGEFDISGDLESKRSITKNVKRVIVHRQYDPATFENDLALLELDSPVSFDTHIVPICMPNDVADFTGRMATVTGWGRLKYGGGVPSVLQEVQVPIIENSVCQEMFHTAGHNKKILTSFLCAGYANGQKDSCEGDSGGPLVLQRPDGRYELAGTVSHGIKCAAPYLPGVYMRTTFYKPWLRSITGVK
ncbi:serine protease filzig isoform X1 [Drosophila gunungcola]|uniref:serine protease filzig isoform X1 n=1 Tax=Drosophila gunungcola TaxID=103775 RepID=UPI0022E0E733|nr:serine protease filzig isoform X1 [Drosophila gunungcola]